MKILTSALCLLHSSAAERIVRQRVSCMTSAVVDWFGGRGTCACVPEKVFKVIIPSYQVR
jgi:hypothetical protein